MTRGKRDLQGAALSKIEQLGLRGPEEQIRILLVEGNWSSAGWVCVSLGVQRFTGCTLWVHLQ